MIPEKIEVILKSDVNNNFRCQVAANSLDIDIHKKSVHHLKINNVKLPNKWNIGLVYGNSGSGKTTMIKHLFGKDIFDVKLNPEEPIINQLPDDLSYEDCATLLNGIGLNSVPCWIRPLKTLSNGQKARAEAVYLMTQNKDIVFIDEWTSVVDRVVARAMSVCLYKYAKKNNKKIVLCSCHYDILEWLNPDWMIDCNKQEFILPKSEDFFFKERDKLKFDIKECPKESWKYFSKYHYLSDQLPYGKVFFYGLFYNNIQIGFQCFANYTPHKKGTKIIFHSNRTVIHPDYNGLGLGLKLVNETTKLMLQKIDCRIMAKFSAIPMYKSRLKDKNWRYLGSKRMMGQYKIGGNMTRSTGFRDKGIKTFHFEYRYE
jgi:energy-coupling factor transporter ATP-binding protein EcfA2|tara:strand:- start:742 stop:1857 length:1116 start_codon:yes stop_codon:yes gene_type:complete